MKEHTMGIVVMKLKDLNLEWLNKCPDWLISKHLYQSISIAREAHVKISRIEMISFILATMLIIGGMIISFFDGDKSSIQMKFIMIMGVVAAIAHIATTRNLSDVSNICVTIDVIDEINCLKELFMLEHINVALLLGDDKSRAVQHCRDVLRVLAGHITDLENELDGYRSGTSDKVEPMHFPEDLGMARGRFHHHYEVMQECGLITEDVKKFFRSKKSAMTNA